MSNLRAARPVRHLTSLALPTLLVFSAPLGCGVAEPPAAEVDSVESEAVAGAFLSVDLFERATGNVVFQGSPTRPATAAEEKALRDAVRSQATATCKAFEV